MQTWISKMLLLLVLLTTKSFAGDAHFVIFEFKGLEKNEVLKNRLSKSALGLVAKIPEVHLYLGKYDAQSRLKGLNLRKISVVVHRDSTGLYDLKTSLVDLNKDRPLKIVKKTDINEKDLSGYVNKSLMIISKAFSAPTEGKEKSSGLK